MYIYHHAYHHICICIRDERASHLAMRRRHFFLASSYASYASSTISCNHYISPPLPPMLLFPTSSVSASFSLQVMCGTGILGRAHAHLFYNLSIGLRLLLLNHRPLISSVTTTTTIIRNIILLISYYTTNLLPLAAFDTSFSNAR